MADILEKYPSLKKFDQDNYQESHDGREAAVLNYIYSHPSLPDSRNSPSKIVELLDEYAAKQDFLINIGPDKGKIATDLIASEKPSVFVELGGYVGYSAILFGDAMRKSHSAKEAGTRPLRYWSLELDPLIAAIAMSLIDLAGLSDIVKVVVGPADSSLKRLHAEGQLDSIDMLFLDHHEDLYKPHLQLCEELGVLKTGATVLADNVVRPGAPEYRKYVREHPGWESQGIKGLIIPGEFEDEMEVTSIKTVA